MTRVVRRGAALVAALALLAVGCGSDDDDAESAATDALETVATELADTEPPATEPPATEPAVTAPPATEPPVTEPAVTEPPATEPPVTEAVDTEPATESLRIVSLSPTHTEMLFAIGADDLLVAVDDQSNYPPEALELPHDLSAFEPSVEEIAAYEPDLVITGGDFTGLGDQLAILDIEAWDGPAAASIDDTYSQIEELGELTGETDNAATVVAAMKSDIDDLLESAPEMDQPLAVYHELDPTLYSVTSSTFIGQIYAATGLRNVADELETDAGPYPQLNAEFLVSANPDLVFLADTVCCGETAKTVAKRPGWDAITAVQNGHVFEMDDDIASRWGPRTVDYLAAVIDALHQASGG